jgi:adenylylsulfate kinase
MDGIMPQATDLTNASIGAAVIQGAAVWLTGLSGAGKSTIARLVHRELQRLGYWSEILDADVFRKTLTRDLGFSRDDREENIRRIGEVAGRLSQQGALVIVAAITPYRSMREELRRQIPHFIEVFIDAPLRVCELRDPKGLYRKARSGEIRDFTGIDSPYEAPLQPDLHCYTAEESIEQCVTKAIKYVLAEVAISGGKRASLNCDEG